VGHVQAKNIDASFDKPPQVAFLSAGRANRSHYFRTHDLGDWLSKQLNYRWLQTWAIGFLHKSFDYLSGEN
jgi:hypothetical protein